MEPPRPRPPARPDLLVSPIKQVRVKVVAPPEGVELSDKHIEKAKVAAAYIKLIYHSQECFGSCGDPRCEKTRELVSHCIACHLGPECPRAGCLQTKTLMNHAHGCKLQKARELRSGGCLICSQLEKSRTDADVESLTAVVAVVSSVSNRHVEKAKEAAKYIKLIHHSQNCFGQCSDPLCSRTQKLVSHCIPCREESACTHPGCRQTKLLMNHVQECKRKSLRGGEGGCLICAQLDRCSVDVEASESSKKVKGEFVVPIHPPKRFRTRLQTINQES